MRTGTLYIISAPSGAGKSSLIKALLQCSTQGDLQVSVSHTTRIRRPEEIPGEHYHFVDQATFESMIEQGAFVEYAKVFDHYYGTARSTVEIALAQGIDLLLDIDWQGACQVRQKMAEVCTIFILPPSRVALEQRLRLRAQDSDSVINQRMASAVNEMMHYLEYDYFIINDDFNKALFELTTIMAATQLRCQHQQSRYIDLLRKLLAP